MSGQTTIEWTDHTFNPWWGCARVSPACRFCYADATATRWGHQLWGRTGPRSMLSEATWHQPVRWNRAARDAGQPATVFCASMADVFEIHPDGEVNAQLETARARLWTLIEQTPHLIWQLLTKRPENAAALVPWTQAWPGNVWLGTSVEDNHRARQRIPVLLHSEAQTRFLSCEPLLEQLDLTPWLPRSSEAGPSRPDWVIVGGESGPRARPMHPDWARSLREQSRAVGVPFFFKQWGRFAPDDAETTLAGSGTQPGGRSLVDTRGRNWCPGQHTTPSDAVWMRRCGKKQAGRVLDGRTWNETPPLQNGGKEGGVSL